MTRETKIGLLVGLAFIIVIGILLSDHLTSSTEPPPASMQQAGANVRSGVNTPARATDSAVTLVPPAQVQPSQQVPTAGDLSPKPQPVKIVQIGAPTGTPQPVNQSVDPAPVANTTDNTSVPLAGNTGYSAPPSGTALPANTESQATPKSDTSVADAWAKLQQVAQQSGESLVSTSGNQTPATRTAPREYKAEAGDTLSKIAARLLGANTRANRDAIVAANPSLKENPNLIVAGRTYVIPATTAGTTPGDPAVSSGTSTPTDPSRPATADNIYVVQSGDNLTRIAIAQLGSANAVAAIKELNRDLLKGGDTIQVGWKLKMPAKSLAQSN